MKRFLVGLVLVVVLGTSVFAKPVQKQVSDCTLIQYDTDYLFVTDRARFVKDMAAVITAGMDDNGWNLTNVAKGWMSEDWVNASWAIPYVDVYGMAMERYVSYEGDSCSFYFYYFDDSFGFDKASNYYVIQLDFVK